MSTTSPKSGGGWVPSTTVSSSQERAGRSRPYRPTPVIESAGHALGHARVLTNQLVSLANRRVERPFAVGQDGFVAVDDAGSIAGGRLPGAQIRNVPFVASRLDPLLKMTARGQPCEATLTLPTGETVEARTDGRGRFVLAADMLEGNLGDLDPARGGVAEIGIVAPKAAPVTSQLLALPRDYDGPIFVSDIDDTLRHTSYADVARGVTQEPIPGAQALLAEVAELGVPIVYLSAAAERIRAHNREFLAQLPPGVLLDNATARPVDALPNNGFRARRQSNYKSSTLAELQQVFPNAKLFGLGDDKYGDAMAYTRAGAVAYIRDVASHDANLPANFEGTRVTAYTPEFREQVKRDLSGAIATSRSCGGTPCEENKAELRSKMLDRLTGTQVLPGNKVDLLRGPDEAFEAIVDTIDSAEETLYYETFEFKPGEEAAEKIADRLLAAHERGVKVRVVADALGSKEFPWSSNPTVDRLRLAGVEVLSYNPIYGIDALINLHRDHRKVVVADRKTAMVGGMNTGDKYMGGPEIEHRYHDAFSRIQGPAVGEIAEQFLCTWDAAGGSEVPASEVNAPVPPAPEGENDELGVRIITHVPGRDQNIRAAYLALIDSATQRINIENDFPMADDVVDSLCAAARRGVEVRYLVGKNDGPISQAALKNLPRLLDAGVRVFVYPEPIHSKFLSVDGQVCTIGSSNFDNVALERNREIIAVVEDPEFTRYFDERLMDQDFVGNEAGEKTVELTRDLEGLRWRVNTSRAVMSLIPNSYE